MLIRIVLTITTLFITFNSFASYGLLSEEERESKLKIIAESNLEKARKDYLEKYYTCIKESEKHNLNKQEFDDVKLTEDEMKIVILYFSAKTMKECVGDIADKYTLANNLARYFNVDGFSIKDDPETENSKYSADILAIAEMKFMADYQQISEGKRKKLEKIKDLNYLFNIKNATKDFMLKSK